VSVPLCPLTQDTRESNCLESGNRFLDKNCGKTQELEHSVEAASESKHALDDVWWLSPSRLFDGKTWHADMALKLRQDCIDELAHKQDIPPLSKVVTTPYMACPGYIDLQVNGGGGVMFNNDPTVAGLKMIGQAHLRLGTTSYLPTFITDTADKLDLAADSVIAAIGQYGVSGIHIEGPHINIARKGTHGSQFIRPFDERTFQTLTRLRQAQIPTMLTLAPECLDDDTIIAKLVAMGVIVSAGHTNASAAQIRTALNQGLSCFTHLHNAMTPMSSREAGVVGEALASQAWCGMICDGHHVDDTVLRLSIQAKEKSGRLFIVSDAMATVGGPNFFTLYGEKIFVENGRLINNQGSLAGAHTSMAQSVHYFVSHLDLSSQQILPMATCVPAQLMKVQDTIGQLVAGAKADIVLLHQDWTVAEIIKHGQYIVSAHETPARVECEKDER